MAIDTPNKRATAPHHFAAMSMPFASGSIDEADRKATSFVYAGLPTVLPAPVTVTNPFARQPFTMVQMTIPGDLTGEQKFFFTPKLGPPGEQLAIALGLDVRPYLLGDPRGRPTKIQPDKGLTERSRVTFNFAEDGDAPDFDDTIFSITEGGEFWRRLRVTQPDYIGSDIEARHGFLPLPAGTTFDDLTLFFKGRIEGMDLQNNGSVSVIAKDELIIQDREAPAQIGDDNLLTAAFGTGVNQLAVTRGSEITDPATLPSKDFYPICIRVNSEIVVVGSVSGNTIFMQSNLARASEDFFDDNRWPKTSGMTVSKNTDVGPFGGTKTADQLNFAAVGDDIDQNSALVATGDQVFAVWIRSFATAGTTETITLEIANTSALQSTSNQVLLKTGWNRFEVTHNFAFEGASVFTVIRIKRQTGDAASVLAFGASLHIGTTRGFYVALTASTTAPPAGRATFGTTEAAHSIGDSFEEVIPYRSPLDPESGVHPIFIVRDLVNRALIPLANVDQDAFDTEFFFIASTELKRSGTNLIVGSKKIFEHITEVRTQALLDLWMSEEGKAKIRLSYRSVTPDETLNVFTDEDHILRRSLGIKNNEESRTTAMIVYYDIKTDADGTKAGDFNKAQVTLNVAVQLLSGRKVKIVFGNWISRRQEAFALAKRYVNRFLRGARRATFSLDLKDEDLFDVGNTIGLNSVDILTRSVSGGTGSAIRFDSVWQVVQKEAKRREGRVQVEVMESSNLRTGFITPTTIAEGGTFANDYDSADASERRFGFISDSNNKVGASLDDGYHIL